jgi:putative zinc finger protein
MDHNEAVGQNATEKYLLDELDPNLRDQFEEHLFDCQDCALDVRAAAMFVEQTKVLLAESPAAVEVRVPVSGADESKRSSDRGWFAWLRPAFAVPVLALLLAVIGYQNLVTYPHLLRAANEPQIGPWASVNVSTRGSSEREIVKTQPGEGFTLLLNLPPDQTYATYTLELYNPAGKLQWAGRIPAFSPDDRRSIYVPGAGLEQGNYTLVTTGVTAAGESSKIESKLIEVQIQK